MIHSLSLNAKARRHLATRGMAELRTATTWNDVGLQGRIHERIERKSVKRMHRVGRGPPHAHFRRTHVSARTLLALYNQARLACLEKAKRLACRVTPVCAPRLVSRNRLGRTPPGTFYAWASARDHFDIWAKSGPCPASYKAVHGWAELVADHATAGFGLPMAQTPLPVAGGMRCRCSIVSSFSPF